MKKLVYSLIAFAFVVSMTGPVLAGEHGGKEHGGSPKGSMMEHGGKEHGGAEAEAAKKEVVPPTNDDIRNTMKSFIATQSDHHGGKYYIKDPDTGEVLGLTMERVHERVGKTGDYYYSCADFKDENGKMWDLDIDVEDKNGKLSVADVRIHKEEGVASYTYDDQDNRHPIVEGTKRHLGNKASAMGQLKGKPKAIKGDATKLGGQEHGGHEHGGQEHGGKEHGGK